MDIILGVYKTHPDVKLPEFQTQEAACFDIAYDPSGKTTYEGFGRFNKKFVRVLSNEKLFIGSFERVMVPTGLIFDIPKKYSIRLHPRSGTSLKKGLVLVNQTGVIDSDYVHETFILIQNMTEVDQVLEKGERIAQAELVKVIQPKLNEITTKPEQKTNRTGGFGSTGV